tara:strand:- start:16305 stop:16796 length:492 start_codon:yes stop_codon:yes gene_type:complete
MDFYKNIVGIYKTTVNIIYADQRRGVQTFGHYYRIEEPQYVSEDKKVVLGRISRYTDPESWKIITSSQEEDVEIPKDGKCSPHLYFMRWNESLHIYDCKFVDVDDTTLGEVSFNGMSDTLDLCSYEVAKDDEHFLNSHVAHLRMVKENELTTTFKCYNEIVQL